MATLFSIALVLTAVPRVLTLEGALETAREHQPLLRQAHANTEAASAVADEARAPLLPQIAATADYYRSTANSILRPGFAIGNAAATGQSSATTYNFFASGITVTQL